MGNRVQPGGRVDEETYERFREWVRAQHGSIRSHLGEELEIAMKERMNTGNGADQITRIENDVATLKAMLADAEGDGGITAPTPSTGSDTHARNNAKPPANQSRQKKLDYLIDALKEEKSISETEGEIPESEVAKFVESEYGFDDQIVSEYVDSILQHFDAVPNPRHGATYVWGEMLKVEREKLEEETSEEMSEVVE